MQPLSLTLHGFVASGDIVQISQWFFLDKCEMVVHFVVLLKVGVLFSSIDIS